VAESNWDETVILDRHHLAGFTGGDTEFEKQVLGIFVDNAPGYLQHLRTCDPGDWKSSAHKLKGAARSIGAWHLARAAERVEHMRALGEDDPKRGPLFDELEGRLTRLLHQIAQI